MGEESGGGRKGGSGGVRSGGIGVVAFDADAGRVHCSEEGRNEETAGAGSGRKRGGWMPGERGHPGANWATHEALAVAELHADGGGGGGSGCCWRRSG